MSALLAEVKALLRCQELKYMFNIILIHSEGMMAKQTLFCQRTIYGRTSCENADKSHETSSHICFHYTGYFSFTFDVNIYFLALILTISLLF